MTGTILLLSFLNAADLTYRRYSIMSNDKKVASRMVLEIDFTTPGRTTTTKIFSERFHDKIEDAEERMCERILSEFITGLHSHYKKKSMSQKKEPMFTYAIYKNPKDFPDRYVVRKWDVAAGPDPEPAIEPEYVGECYEDAVQSIPAGKMKFPIADPDPCIIEVYI